MIVETLTPLEALYHIPLAPASVVTETDHITPDDRRLIEATPARAAAP